MPLSGIEPFSKDEVRSFLQGCDFFRNSISRRTRSSLFGY
jgi:hypothetical protein